MNAYQAARRSRDLEFAAFTALARVLIDSSNFIQAQAVVIQAAKALNIPDELALQIIEHCMDESPLECKYYMTHNFEELDQKMTHMSMLQSVYDDGSQLTPAHQACPMDIITYLFDDLIGYSGPWVKFSQLLEAGGSRYDFLETKAALIKMATNLRNYISIE